MLAGCVALMARRRLLVAAVALLLVMSTGWLGWVETQRRADAALAAAAPITPASAAVRQPLASAWLPSAGDVGTVSEGVGAVSPKKPSQADADVSTDAEVEICGLGRVSRREAERWNPVELMKAKAHMDALDRRKDAAMSRLSARLAAGSDSERVAARLVMRDAEGAAAIAARSSDAAAYRLGLMGCRGHTGQSAPSCQGMTPQGWLQLAPDDASAWINLAADAMAKRDEAAATEAIEQMLQRYSRSASRPLLQVIHGVRDRTDDAVGLGMAVVEIIGVEAAMPGLIPSAMSRYCSAKAVKDEARRARCERVARWEFEHAESLFDAAVAINIADKVGIPLDQRPYTQEQLTRAQAWWIAQADKHIGMDCARMALAADMPALLSQKHELQAALKGIGLRQ